MTKQGFEKLSPVNQPPESDAAAARLLSSSLKMNDSSGMPSLVDGAPRCDSGGRFRQTFDPARTRGPRTRTRVSQPTTRLG
jgi:hypothetical protein